MASRLQGGLCSCRSDMWRSGMVHHGSGPTEVVPCPWLSCTLETCRGTSFLYVM